MQGIEIAKAYWEQCGRPVIEQEFPELMKYIAVGLVGAGSECFGFDDELSRDHDFGPGFCIFLPGEDMVDRRLEFLLERAYAKLPKEFMGLKKELMNPAGGNRCGVFRTADWYREKTGLSEAPCGWQDFMSLPDHALAEAVNGEIFYDAYGEFSAIRKAWQAPPQDYIYKKLCGALISMSQAGEYNYPRCLRRNDRAAAHLCADEFVKAAVTAVFACFGMPVPYYKWTFRALKDLEKEKRTAPFSAILEEILYSEEASALIAEASGEILSLTASMHLQGTYAADLQSAAFELNNRVADPQLRNLSPLAAI